MWLEGLVAWGTRQWAGVRAQAVLTLVLGVLLAACGSDEGRKRAVECQSVDDCDPSTLGVCDTVACEENRCVLGSRPDGHRCDDSDPLTGEDACLDGICAGVVVTCDDDLGPCLKAVHDPETDECVVEPADDDTPCDDDNSCTQLDSCQAGECVGSKPVTCSAGDDCHLDGECDPKTGECSEPKADDGAPCDDGQACTSEDSCQDGACAGAAVACDDGLGCSVDSCDEKSGACAADMTACSCVVDADCDDGNACNGQEVCGTLTKLCQLGAPVVCPASGDACLKSVCVAETGACEPEPVSDGTACDDLDACTGRDTCRAGACVGSDAVVCTALSQCHTPGTCDKVTGACSNPERAKNSSCNDGNACTATDTCQAGACVGAGQVSCSALDQCHVAGVCAAATGICSKPSKPDGVQCNDANPCTSGDACQAGVCTPASQVTCPASNSCHSAGTCDSTTGKCSDPVKPNGTSCNDGSVCKGPDTCVGGTCTGAAITCDDKVACTTDSCSEQLGGCTVDSTNCACEVAADCDDGNPCNGVETCSAAKQCLAGTAVNCSALSNDCNLGACNPATGACVAAPKTNGTTCNDGNACTSADSCQAGACVGANPVTCPASDQCHDAGTCNTATGACSNPAKKNGVTCDDGNACTKADSCQSGVCTGASAVVCSAKDQCHVAGTCNTSSGLCDDPIKKNGTACNDGSLCTKTDTCQGGVCSGASPVVCAASDQCHLAGTCDDATGTCSNPAKKNGTSCADGNACTQTDTCQSGTCTGTNAVVCTASDQCHAAGTCDPANGTCSDPTQKDGTTCSDGNACTKTDTCLAGACKGASPVTCSAIDQCHDAGSCNTVDGECSNPNKADNTPCGDGKACTSGDKCTKGVCGGAAVTCDDKIACTVDSCAEPAGCNFDQSKCGCTKDADCNDKNACNGVETCNLSTLSCVAGTPVSCSALDDVCNTGTCDPTTGACKATPKTNGTACDDGNACTKTDGCTAGKCTGSNSVTCTAIDQCHAVGVCDTKTGACSNPNAVDGTTCNDGNKCTATEACKTGVCTATSLVTCPTPDQCHTLGVCNATTGTCVNPEKTGKCDDGDKCTQTDTCQSGVCTGANSVVCSALDECHEVGVCNKGTGVCSNPNANQGDDCSDSNACTTGEACDGSGQCGGGTNVVCPVLACNTNTCDSGKGCVAVAVADGTPCDDGSACSLGDHCGKGACFGDKRANKAGDWADDPGAPVSLKVPTPLPTGPTSVDLFTDKAEVVHAVGTYVGKIAFNDKDALAPAPTALALGANQETGIYWVKYSEAGAVLLAGNLGGVARGGTLTVEHATAHPDGSFSLLGTIFGNGEFGFNGKTVPFDATKGPFVFVVHYLETGEFAWLVRFAPSSQSAFTADSVAAFDDGSLIAIGANGGTMDFFDVSGASFGSALKPGIWAARLSSKGVGQWGSMVVARGASAGARAVTTHEDGSASLTGGFTGTAGLGPNGELPVSVGAGERGRDIWFEKLDKSGKLLWGGRVGGANADVPGDVARIKGGGLLLLANTAGSTPNANDAKNTVQLHATPASLQAHVLGLDAEGVLQTDGLIADAESGVSHGWQLKLDANGFYAVAGTFGARTMFWSKVGFGAGAPKGGADFAIASSLRQAGPSTLFLARVVAASAFPWGIAAGGDNSGMTTTPWDVVLTAHPSHSATVAGIFNQSATFGDPVKTETLSSPLDATGAPSPLGSPFVVHLNSQAEYDYCP